MPAEPQSGPHPSASPGRLAAIAVLTAVALAGGWIIGRGARPAGSSAGAAALSRRFAAIERQVEPAVVKIIVETPRRPLLRGGLHLPPGLLAPPSRSRVEHSLGSGIIVSSSGYIVTNRHVVDHAARIAVAVPGDPHTYFAKLAGMDTETDLAVIHINAGHPLPVARLGGSRRLRVGDWVVAIGSPFGLQDTVTAGIISALDRPMDPARQFESFIQTDAPINPGNSGGPLIDLAGHVVGINTAIYTESEGYQGVGFALPSRLVKQVYPQLERKGFVTRGSIGVYFESALPPAVRRVYGIGRGVPLTQIAVNGPAQRAGLRPGDVITSLDGRPIDNGNQLMDAVEFRPAGQRVQVGFERAGLAHTVAVEVVDRARLYPQQAAAQPPPPQALAPAAPDLGLRIADLPGGHGAQVTAVVPDSFADSIGVERDDVVVQMDREPVRSAADFARLAARVRPGQDVALVMRRPNGDGTVSRWMVGGTYPPPRTLPITTRPSPRAPGGPR
jgi:serine protease Do